MTGSLAGKMNDAASAMERVACNVCGSAATEPLFPALDHLSREEFVVVRCVDCGLCYVNPRPSPQAISRYYPEHYYGKRHPFLLEWVMWMRARRLPRRADSSRLLDIGCGHGDFIVHCRQAGWDVVGIEQRDSPIMTMRQALGLTIIEPDAMAALAGESFDAVTMWHVLEHLHDPATVLAQVHRLLKPAASVIIEVPNFGGWEGRLGRELWFHLDLPRHLFHFDRRSLEQLLVRQGLQPYRWETLSLEYGAFGIAQTLLNRICSSPSYLFQMLIRRSHPELKNRRDTVLSLLAFPILLPLGLAVSLLAAFRGQGGVLRVWARKEC